MSEVTKKKREWRKADGSKLPPASEPMPTPATDKRQDDLFGNGPNADDLLNARDRGREFSFFAHDPAMAEASPAERAMRFMHGLSIPEGPNAGKPVKLAPFQRQFIEGAMAPDISNAILSIGRGNAKTALTAGIALGGLLGVWDRQPRREIVVAARTRDQGKIAWDFAAGFAATLPSEIQKQLIYRRAPRLEIEFEGDGGGHVLRVIAADGKSALGGAPTMVIMDERGHWALDRGDELEHALLSGMGKRGGRAFLISTSASDDTHPFSRWIDDPLPGSYVQEHRPSPGLPADDRESLLIANPGSEYGIGSSMDWLEAQAKRAIARGGSSLTSFRLYNRNERVSGETRELLVTMDEWLACEAADLPPRQGGVVIGIDLGGSASMTAAAFYWPETGRLECLGTFPSAPSLLDRGQSDGVSDRYVKMQDRGELTVLGDRTVPVAPWLAEVLRHVEGQTVSAITMDRYKQAELSEGLNRAGRRAGPLLRRSSLTGAMLHAVESALAETFENAPLGSLIVPLPDGGSEDMANMRHAFRRRRGSTLVIEGVAQATAAGMNPQLGQKPDQLSPDLSKSMTAETLTAARAGILMAYGVLPSLLNPAATGPVVREAQRQLALWTMQPIAQLLAQEATAKLGQPVTVDTIRPLQAFDAGGRARALSAIVKTMAEAKDAGIAPADLAGAMRMVDWTQ